MSLDQTAQWRKTNLAYDDAEWDYPKYTHAVIARGHALVVEFCERLAGEQDGSPTPIEWQGSSCSSCGSSLRWIDGRILDGLTEEMAGETPREERS